LLAISINGFGELQMQRAKYAPEFKDEAVKRLGRHFIS
jgi:hypothetical protein